MTDQTAPERDPLVERIAAELYDDATTHKVSPSWADAHPRHRAHYYLQAAAVIESLELTVDELTMTGDGTNTYRVSGGWFERVEASR